MRRYTLVTHGSSYDGALSMEVFDPDGLVVMNNETYYPYCPSTDNMRRITACLNACLHIPTEELEAQFLLLHGPPP